VVAARLTHKELLTAAIYSCELEKTTAAALTAMYMVDAQGKHVDPGATENENCDDLVEGLIVDIGEKIRPAKAALVALLKMGPSERTQGWFPKNFEHGMRLLGEPLKKGQDLPGPCSKARHGGRHVGS